MPSPQAADQTKRFEAALRDMATSASQLRMYPPGSPVVGQAVGRAHSSLTRLLNDGPIRMEVLPLSFRLREEECGKGMPLIQNLAADLHGHGVAVLHLDETLGESALQRLIELIVSDRDQLIAGGGFEQIVRDEGLVGISVERIRLERLFAAADADATVRVRVSQ